MLSNQKLYRRARGARLAVAAATLSILAATATLVAEAAPAGAANAAICIDSSSPTAAIDRRVAHAAERVAGIDAAFHSYDGSLGVSDRLFKKLMREDCALMMGIPVDPTSPDPPRGLALTRGYYTTGYVIASVGRALTVATIPSGSNVAVGLGTVPNFYLVGALGNPPPLRADPYQSQEEALDALVKRRVPAAMLWAPSVARYDAAHPAAHVLISPLHVAHATWSLAALYDPRAPEVAKRFERALESLSASGELARLTKSS